jgi:hypothetical protein
MAPKRGKSRWVKIVALVLVAALVVGLGVAGLIAALASRTSVEGTYSATDGRTLTLGKGSAATLKVPSVNQPLAATWKVDGDVVKIFDSADQSQSISFNIQGGDLVGPDGGVWKKQKK